VNKKLYRRTKQVHILGVSNSDNIRAMLQAVRNERADLRARDETLAAREQTLIEWLREEGVNSMQAALPIDDDASPLTTFLSSVLEQGQRLRAADFGRLAVDRGLIASDVSPGRAVHGALLALSKQGHARRHADGTWTKP
jgi:hypothetical protein